MKNISKLSLKEVCNYIACMNKLVEEKIVIFKPNKAFIKFNYDKATGHLEKQNIEQKEEIERLNSKWLDEIQKEEEMEEWARELHYIIKEVREKIRYWQQDYMGTYISTDELDELLEILEKVEE